MILYWKLMNKKNVNQPTILKQHQDIQKKT